MCKHVSLYFWFRQAELFSVRLSLVVKVDDENNLFLFVAEVQNRTFSPFHQSLVVNVKWVWSTKTRLFVVLTAGECKYSLSFVLPADKLQLHSPSKNISNPVQPVRLVWSFILGTLNHIDYKLICLQIFL